jgi:hypothetical protein
MCYRGRVWTVVFHPEAEAELDALPVKERVAVMQRSRNWPRSARRCRSPHQSNVKGAERLRELRPRSGRSPWRPLYGRVADTFVVVAVGPEALVDPRRFRRTLAAATKRLDEIEA